MPIHYRRSKMSLKIFLLLLVTVAAQDLTLRIDAGLISGKYMTSKNGRRFTGFIGIPYAEPPVGPLRFKPPVPKSRWLGVRQSLDKVNICPQVDLLTNQTLIQGNEDCLYLNVFTPKLTNLPNFDLRPVMLFIHGGAYNFGHANAYQPEILLNHDVVLIVINYRLGALGFLTTGDNVVPGNNGLKDQNIAIRWARRNVRVFGGDPNLITLFGESAGGSSVHMHMMSPLSRGLFQAAISESGTALGMWSFGRRNDGVQNGRKLAEIFGCPTCNNVRMVECLRQQNAYDFIRVYQQFQEFVFDPAAVFKPIDENNHPGAFLTQHPIHYIRSGRVSNIPWITGLNTEEGGLDTSYFIANPSVLEGFKENFSSIAPGAIGYDDLVANVDATTRRIREYYFKNGISADTKDNITNFYTDGLILSSVDTSIRMHLRYAKIPIYYYLFSYRGTYSLSQIFGDPNLNYGVTHFDEVLYLFPFSEYIFGKPLSATDNQMADVLTNFWYNLARIGKPTRNTDAVDWVRVRANDAMEYLAIGGPNNLNLKTGVLLERARFWRPIVDEFLSNV